MTETAYGTWNWVNLESGSVLSRHTHVAKCMGWNFIVREYSAFSVPSFHHITHRIMFVSRPIGILLLKVPKKRVKIEVVHEPKNDGAIGLNR